MSQMPSKIWLHKDTKYSTGDIVCGYQYDFVQGIEDEGGIENFLEYVPADAFIEKACDTYCKVCGHYSHAVPTHICRHDCRYFSDFKKYMKRE